MSSCDGNTDIVLDVKKSEHLDIRINEQEKSQWCYAAIIEAVAKYYGVYKHNNLGITLNQENISNWYIHNVKDFACTSNTSGVNCPQDPAELLDQLKQVNGDQIYKEFYNKKGAKKYITHIMDGINANYPTIARIGDRSGYHYVLFIGYKTTVVDISKIKANTGMVSFQYLDPLHPTEIRSVTDICLFDKGINADFIDSTTNETHTGFSPLDGIMILFPKAEAAGGGKRNTRRRRSKTRAMKKTLRRH